MDSVALSPAALARLDTYEAVMRRRVAPELAVEHRREIEAHLVAEIAARRELGAMPEEAEREALRSLGDLRESARRERRDPRDVALLVAPLVWVLSYAVLLVTEAPATVAVALVLNLPALVLVWLGSAGRTRLRLGVLTLGWSVAFLPTLSIFAFMVSDQAGWPEGVATGAGLTLGTLLAAHGLCVGLSLLIRRDREFPGAFWLRLASPVLYIFLVEFLASTPGGPGDWPYLAWLPLALSVAGQRRLDLRAAALGSVAATATLVASALAFFHASLSELQWGYLLGMTAGSVVSLLAVQAFGIGVAALLRRARWEPRRRAV